MWKTCFLSRLKRASKVGFFTNTDIFNILDSLDINKYTELYQDFLHPNPNINYHAFLILRKEFEVTFISNLLANLNVEDIYIRRKSILALGRFGEKILKLIMRS